jgi:hypothetical protein
MAGDMGKAAWRTGELSNCRRRETCILLLLTGSEKAGWPEFLIVGIGTTLSRWMRGNWRSGDEKDNYEMMLRCDVAKWVRCPFLFLCEW